MAHQVARRLAREKAGEMTCLAAMGCGLSGFLESARSASQNLVIDGCWTGCGKKIFDNQGIPYRHFVMTEYRVEKGWTPITEELIEKIKRTLKAEQACGC